MLALSGVMVVVWLGAASAPLANNTPAPDRNQTFVPPMMFNNAGNMGLPLALLAYGEAALPAAVVLFMVVTSNT